MATVTRKFRDDFEAWAARRPGTLHITHHRGLLGARVLTDITD